ncbi:TPA: hypothetical protein U2D00_001935 [Streptococcus suis]|nr:hypothetical protein [Streptococcus suis]HEL2254980.1 hypothetical protein [Streptococcus suis]HEL2265742.1 hypothetical protein [Streptococcus suis]HEL2299046.1 hypothetical protein [Streptococcus suis]HEL2407155.1 hypothetical protein [Streptococcus suis]
MYDAIASVAFFALPVLAAGVVEQRKAEKEQKRRELALLLDAEFEKLRYKTWAQAERYYKTCQKESAKNNLKRNGQQVDKERDKYARMVS